MLVQQVLEFIDRLRNEHVHIECDIAFRKSISDFFSQKSSGNEAKNDKKLSEEDFSFLLNCYAIRSNEIHAKYRDAGYTSSNSSFNQKLIKFAADLAKERSMDLRAVLIPTVNNLVDPSDLSQIKDFSSINLSDFHITDDLMLQRKLPWLQCMIEHDNVLFSFSSLEGESRKKAASVYELKSLKNCSDPIFWTKLKEEIFPSLTKSGKLSEEVVVLLSELLHSYFSLKQSQKNIHSFNDAIQNFFQKLSTSSLADINFLYGKKIKYQGNESYLLDLLISLTTASSFNVQLEQEMHILLDIVRSAKSAELVAYEKLHSILVSLVVTDFNLYRFTGAYVLSWDTCSHIPSALSPVFNSLKSICSTTPNYMGKYNEILELRAASQDSAATSSAIPKNYVARYNEILSMLVLPSNPAGSLWAWLTVNAQLFNWISEITISEQPSKLGGYWFEPSVIMFSILQLPPSDHNDKLLDGLISTYSQMRMSDFMQQLRLNKLFSEYMSELSEFRRKNILSLIETCNVDKAKKHFFNNCTTYLDRRLRELGENLDDESPSFFASNSIAVSNPENMLALLTLYTTKLAKRHTEPQLSPGLLYLHDLKDTILRKKEIWDAHRAVVGTEDTLGPQGAR